MKIKYSGRGRGSVRIRSVRQGQQVPCERCWAWYSVVSSSRYTVRASRWSVVEASFRDL